MRHLRTSDDDSGTALAATWDKKGVKALGALLSGEAKAKSSSAVLAPTVNIQRSPLNGRVSLGEEKR